MPDDSAGAGPADVLIVASEDDVADTIIPRLLAAGADLNRVHSIRAVEAQGKSRPVSIPEDIDLIEAELVNRPALLMIIDPLNAVLDARIDSHKDHDIRHALHPLKELAEQAECAIVFLRHLNKGGGGGKALYRGLGSIGIVAAARSALLNAQDPDSPAHHILASTKCNLARRPRSLRYALDPDEAGVCRIAWCGESRYTADDLVSRPETAAERDEREQEKSKLDQARELLLQMLTSGPVHRDRCIAELAEAGIGQRTVERAASLLKVQVLSPAHHGVAKFSWALPTAGYTAADGELARTE
jgi:RecA-family ATPase